MIGDEELIAGRPVAEVCVDLPARLSHKILKWVELTPEAIALQEEGRRWSYAEFGQAIEAAKLHLTEHNVRAGDRIMLVGENSCALLAFLMAVSELDAWVAIINARLSAREIDAIREDCDPRHLIYTAECSAESTTHATRHEAEFEDHALLGRFAFKGPFETTAEPVFSKSEDQVFAMIYTSGTTGTPKGVMLTHRNIGFIATVSGALRGLSATDRVYAVLPISHIFGFASTAMGTLFTGGMLYLAPRFNAECCLNTLKEEMITVLQGVPAMFTALIELQKSRGERASELSLRYMSCGGAPLDPDTKKMTEEFFGLTLNNGYGLTEASPTITQTRISEPQQNCSTGRPLPGVEVRLMNIDGTEVTNSDIGELWVRGPNIMKGYFRKPEQTAEVVDADGWLNTQDLAQVDDEGNVTIVGRTKEMIVRSGFNVYPAEVEAVLNAHPDITHSAVIGKEINGDETVLAFVQPAIGSKLTAEDLKAYCKKMLTPYKCPSKFTLMPQLPATATGKILKSSLKELDIQL